jgi:hypothetical protein
MVFSIVFVGFAFAGLLAAMPAMASLREMFRYLVLTPGKVAQTTKTFGFMRKTIMIKPREFFLLLSTVFLLGVLLAQAGEPQQPSKQDDEELVKQTQNPVADLISVPFQNNYNFAAGPEHNHMLYLLNIQPVIPVHITENWNLIARVKLFNDQPWIEAGTRRVIKCIRWLFLVAPGELLCR